MVSEADARWEAHRERLAADLGDGQAISFFIPNCDHSQWQELAQNDAMRWLQHNHYQAMYVDHRLIEAGSQVRVYFKVWEYGDPEPDWGAVIPV